MEEPAGVKSYTAALPQYCANRTQNFTNISQAAPDKANEISSGTADNEDDGKNSGSFKQNQE
jgi:hypothetical protein